MEGLPGVDARQLLPVGLRRVRGSARPAAVLHNAHWLRHPRRALQPLATDLANNALPAFSFITPNLIDDMHDGTIADGDSWLASNLPTILNSTEYQAGNTAVFITWDEGTGGKTGEDCTANTTDPSCLVATMVISPSTPAGATSATLFNHYSLLGTAEQLLGLPALGQAASYPTMTAAFNL